MAIHQKEHSSLKTLNGTLTDLLKKCVFGKSYGDWINERNIVTKRYKNVKLSWTELTPIQPSLERIEGILYQEIIGKVEKRTPNWKIGESDGYADNVF